MSFVIVEHNGSRYRVALAPTSTGVWVGWRGGAAFIPSRQQPAHNPVTDAEVVAPMTGKIIEVHVAPGDEVEPEQVLIVLEAMKMEYRLTAGRAATVRDVHCHEGMWVDHGVTLVTLDADAPRASP